MWSSWQTGRLAVSSGGLLLFVTCLMCTVFVLDLSVAHIPCGRLPAPPGPPHSRPAENPQTAGLHQERAVYRHRHPGECCRWNKEFALLKESLSQWIKGNMRVLMQCEQEAAAWGNVHVLSELHPLVHWMNLLVFSYWTSCQTNILSELILMIGEAEMFCCPFLILACWLFLTCGRLLNISGRLEVVSSCCSWCRRRDCRRKTRPSGGFKVNLQSLLLWLTSSTTSLHSWWESKSSMKLVRIKTSWMAVQGSS